MAGTKANLGCQWKAFVMFCLYFDLVWLPASENTVALFAQMLYRSFKSAQTVKNYVSAVKLMHILLDKSCQAFDNLKFKLAVRGMTRLKSYQPKQALPITAKLLLQIYNLLEFNQINDFVFWSLFLVAFFTMSRKSNLVVTLLSEKVRCLTHNDIIIGQHSLLVIFKWSKTNQFGDRVHKIPLTELKGSPLCPVEAYKNMCGKLSVVGHSPAFCIVKGAGIVPVTYQDLQAFLRVQVAKLDLNPLNYTSHSFRRGGYLSRVQGRGQCQFNTSLRGLVK